MRKTVFFDTETNNLRNDRICQLAMICEEDGQVIFQKSWYINPESPFSEHTIRIHGITPDLVKDAPIFPEIWETIHSYFDSSLVVGHNVSFDLTVLDKVLQFYDIKADTLIYADTMSKAGQVSSSAESFSLHSLCDAFHVSLDHHHDALCDAEACRELYHIFDQKRPWTDSDEQIYRFGKAVLKASVNDLKSAFSELFNILSLIYSDGTVSYSEIKALEDWRDTHFWQRKYPGFTEAYSVVNHFLDTGSIAEDSIERIHLLLCRYCGKGYSKLALQKNSDRIFA